MARPNKLGSSWQGIQLPPELEKKAKRYCKDNIVSGKQFLRYLVREHFKKQNV